MEEGGNLVVSNKVAHEASRENLSGGEENLKVMSQGSTEEPKRLIISRWRLTTALLSVKLENVTVSFSERPQVTELSPLPDRTERAKLFSDGVIA